jgi:hypothetical protein
MDYFDLTKTFDVFNLAATQVRGIRNFNGKTQTVGGVFSNVGNLINSIESAVGGNMNWYFVFNEIDASVLKNKVIYNENNECLKSLKSGGGDCRWRYCKKALGDVGFRSCKTKQYFFYRRAVGKSKTSGSKGVGFLVLQWFLRLCGLSFG